MKAFFALLGVSALVYVIFKAGEVLAYLKVKYRTERHLREAEKRRDERRQTVEALDDTELDERLSIWVRRPSGNNGDGKRGG